MGRAWDLASRQGRRRARRATPGPTASRPVRAATRLWLLAAKSQAANLLREEENLVEFSYLVWTLLFARTLILRAEACDAERDVDDRETERDREILPKQWGGADGVEVLHPT